MDKTFGFVGLFFGAVLRLPYNTDKRNAFYTNPALARLKEATNKMKANELRIGNHLYDSRLKVVKIECLMSDRYVSWDGRDSNLEFSFQSDDINMYHPEPNELCPIPLTDEILRDWCGFDKSNGILYEKGRFALKEWKAGSEIEWVIFWNENVILYKQNVKVHQLQNLYFALTGEELEVKLPTSHRKV